MPRFRFALPLAGIFLLPWFVAPAAAAETDPHKIYETSCGNCHYEHAGDLARLKLELADGKVRVARTRTAMTDLLRKHHGVKLGADETRVLLELFVGGIKWAGVFQHRCARCHEKAAPFAREKLVEKDGKLRSKASDADMAEFLKGHGEATPDEVALLLDMLAYQVRTAPPR